MRRGVIGVLLSEGDDEDLKLSSLSIELVLSELTLLSLGCC